MSSQGSTTIDFGSTPSDTANVVVTGQTGIVSGSHVEAFFMRDTNGDNGTDEHEEGSAMCNLVCGSVVAGTGFTVYAHTVHALAVGQFNIRWVWN